MIRATLAALALGCSLAAVAVAAADEKDPYLWLENIEGAKALDWVKKENAATDKLIVHFLGLTLLDGLGIRMGDCEFVSVGTHQKAAQAVLDGRCDAGFVFNETWQGLSGSTRAGLAVAAQTRSRQASHCFCVGPELAERADEIRDLLCAMCNDPAGQRVLEDLRFTGFEPMPADAVATLQALVQQSA